MGLQSRAVVGLVLVACSRAMDTGLSRHAEAISGHVEATSGHVEATSGHVGASSGHVALTQRDIELVLGAERAMEAGPGTITVTDTEHGHCVLAVRDTGAGAPGEHEDRRKIFLVQPNIFTGGCTLRHVRRCEPRDDQCEVTEDGVRVSRAACVDTETRVPVTDYTRSCSAAGDLACSGPCYNCPVDI